jgi:hypothetical protein
MTGIPQVLANKVRRVVNLSLPLHFFLLVNWGSIGSLQTMRRPVKSKERPGFEASVSTTVGRNTHLAGRSS